MGKGRLAPFELRAELRLTPFERWAERLLPSCSFGHAFQPSRHSERRSPFALLATRTAATGHIFRTPNRRPSRPLPGPSRLLLGPALRWREALPPETERFASRSLEQAALEGRERDDACRAACGTRQFFPKTDRARARSELGESQRGCRRGLEGASLSAGGASGSELIASGRASSGFAGRASLAANERGMSGG